MITILNKGYLISNENITTLENFKRFEYNEFKTNLPLMGAVENILKESIGTRDYELNYDKIDIYSKYWFLTYILMPVQLATTYKEVLKILYNQHSMNSIFRNSILLMIKI